MSDTANTTRRAGFLKVSRRDRFGYKLRKVREYILESKAHQGLGGPPNGWQHSPRYKSCQWGHSTGIDTVSMSFLNDAGDVGVWVRFKDDTSDGRWEMILAAPDFRKLALWYLRKWAFGEWFGLRRKLFYWDLHRRIERMNGRRP